MISGAAAASSPVLQGAMAVWQDVFAPDELDRIEQYGDRLAQQNAELSSTSTDYDGIRITQVAWFSRDPQTESVYRRLEEIVLRLNAQYFRYDLSGLAMFQYAVYRAFEKGHFDWHKDYGRDSRDPASEPRKLTLSLQLSEQSAYKGCELQVRGGNQIDVAPRARGTLVAFPANVLHRVTPVTAGIRKALVIWAAGPEFR
jgi:PKHD-type hydroxylase